jgi:amino acid adenylation domain-containing protein
MLLEQFLESSARAYPDKPALICGRSCLSYAELESRANRLAHGLRALGIERGDRVVIHLGNSAEAVVALFAVMKAGAVFLMPGATVKPKRLSMLLTDSRARAILVPERNLPSVWPRVTEARDVTTVITTTISALPAPAGRVPSDEPSTSTHGRPCVVTLGELLDDDRYAAAPPPKTHIDVDLAALVYTSGTTGRPKGVMLAHRNVVAAATAITTCVENVADDVILSVLPFSFNYGLYQPLMAAQFGSTLVLERSFAYPAAVLKKAAEHRATGLPIVPTMLAMLLQLDFAMYDLGHLRYVTNTGAALPVEHIRQLRARLPNLAIHSMYGLTECKRVTWLPPDEIDARPDSVGRAMPNCEAYLVDEHGNRVPPGGTGQMVVRGSNVMPGYWERPEETAAAFKPGPLPGEHVLMTGDLLRGDEDGYFYFIARQDDMIKSRGEKVSPREVEDALNEHPAVAEAAVIGTPDAILGQAVRAFVALGEGHSATPRELRRHCAERLEDFMVPKEVIIVENLPRTQNGKVDRRALAEERENATTAGSR